MKYIIIGLGRFGSRLATNLISMGHEVIGIDNNAERLEEYKDSIPTIMKMDSTNVNAVKSLPLDDIDAIIVTMGEDVAASVLTLSILKNLNVKRIMGRAINQIHRDILTQIGIEEVILPLEDSALHVSSMLQLKNALRVIEISNDYVIAEVFVPEKYVGHLLETVNIRERFNIKVVAIKSAPEEDLLSSIFHRNHKVNLFYETDKTLVINDILVIAGKISDIKKFMES